MVYPSIASAITGDMSHKHSPGLPLDNTAGTRLTGTQENYTASEKQPRTTRNCDVKKKKNEERQMRRSENIEKKRSHPLPCADESTQT